MSEAQNLYEKPIVVVIGSTGTGKSSLCNILCGIDPLDPNATFHVSDKVDGCTFDTTAHSCKWLGNGKKFTIIDTPGMDDPEGRDTEHIAKMVNKLKEIQFVNAFVIVFNGQNPRIERSLGAMLEIFQAMFGTSFWDNTVIEFSRWSYSRHDKKKRDRIHRNEESVQQEWSRKLCGKFGISRKVPAVFIDTHYDTDEYEEVKGFNTETAKLYEIISSLPDYECKDFQKVLAQMDQLKTEKAQAEAERDEAADKKEKAEAEKKKAEDERKLAETEKKKAEDERKLAEAGKKKAEDKRKLAEAEKKKAEDERKLAEAEKKKTEDEMKLAEAEKKTAEDGRKLAEIQRENEEKNRQRAEREAEQEGRRRDEAEQRATDERKRAEEAGEKALLTEKKMSEIQIKIAQQEADRQRQDAERLRKTNEDALRRQKEQDEERKKKAEEQSQIVFDDPSTQFAIASLNNQNKVLAFYTDYHLYVEDAWVLSDPRNHSAEWKFIRCDQVKDRAVYWIQHRDTNKLVSFGENKTAYAGDPGVMREPFGAGKSSLFMIEPCKEVPNAYYFTNFWNGQLLSWHSAHKTDKPYGGDVWVKRAGGPAQSSCASVWNIIKQ